MMIKTENFSESMVQPILNKSLSECEGVNKENLKVGDFVTVKYSAVC